MPGIVTRDPNDFDSSPFDRVFYEVKDVTGRQTDPNSAGISMISCFGDTAKAENNPSLVPEDEQGTKATREQTYFDWGYICPSRPDYQKELLEIIDKAAGINPHVRLDDVGFPRQGYCHCEVCREMFSKSEYDDWYAWRANVITDFVRAATARIPGRVFLTLYPDPYPGHIYNRAGLDIDALAPLVDEFIVPIYDMAYSTTYWLEIIASGFKSLLDSPFTVELYAIDISPDQLAHATEVAAEYADNIIYAYDADNALTVVNQLDEG